MGPLKKIGEIQLFAEIFEGVTTTVYKGYQPSLERTVLVKVLNTEFSLDDNYGKGFETEAKLIAKVQHPNVVAIYEFGREGDNCYFVAEFVEGLNLKDLLKNCGKLPPELAWFILVKINRGLEAAHNQDILHKDIKPANILISSEGQVKVTDFGLASLRGAKRHRQEEISGTLAYMSPEQILGEQIDKHSDIFSLGATFYEMLTGIPAFTGKSANEYVNAILNYEPTVRLEKRTQLPRELVRICKKMLMKKPGERYRNCREVRLDLENFQAKTHLRVTAAELKAFVDGPERYASTVHLDQITEKEVVSTESGRRKVWVPTMAALLVLILVGSYFGFRGHETAETNTANVMLEGPSESPANLSGAQPTEGTESEAKQDLKPVSRRPDSAAKLPSDAATPEKKDTTHSKPALRTEETTVADSLPKPPAAILPSFGYLRVLCTPWAVVYLNSDSLTTTPMQIPLRLRTGRYQLQLKNPEFPEYETSIDIKESEETKVEFSLWKLVGVLKIVVSPWADVYIDGEKKDTVPPQSRPLVLRPGRHSLMLRNPKLGEWSTEFEISANETLQLKFNLRELLRK